MGAMEGGWLVSGTHRPGPKRQEGSIDALCSWSSYEAGLGSQESELWLGMNICISLLSGVRSCSLQGAWGHPLAGRMSTGTLRAGPSMSVSPQVPGSCRWSWRTSGNHTFAHYETFHRLGETDHYQLVLGKASGHC
ncbi:hypothetical protein J0S82_005155, partial [Galemys pyrenaicus]